MWVQTKTMSPQFVIFLTYNFILILLFEKDSWIKGSFFLTALYAQRIRLPMQETQVESLGREDSLEKEMATHSSILAGIIPWTEEPGGLQSME